MAGITEDEKESASNHAADIEENAVDSRSSLKGQYGGNDYGVTKDSSPSLGTAPVESMSANGESITSGNKEHNGVNKLPAENESADVPPLPIEEIPPLPAEDLPPLPIEDIPITAEADDGWAPIWEETAQAFYFYNRFTGATQWHNPRVPEIPLPPGIDPSSVVSQPAPPTGRPAGGYDPAIHGDYDENAWYAQPAASEQPPLPAIDPAAEYAASANFNRFTGRFQAADITPENFNDENKSKRQMNAFFDVDAAANSHDGRSLKEERSGKKLSKQELKQFKEKRKAKKEEKRRAWLRD